MQVEAEHGAGVVGGHVQALYVHGEDPDTPLTVQIAA